VDLIGKGRGAGIWLVEHKTKGDIDEQRMKRQLGFDLQTMIYLIALQHDENGEIPSSAPIKGVQYNVVRRPLSGGKYSVRQHKPSKANPRGESSENPDPWEKGIISGKAACGGIHWRTPYGFYNVLAEGGSTELDEYLATGSELGLERTSKLFRELE
jgi:hypothetical protein